MKIKSSSIGSFQITNRLKMLLEGHEIKQDSLFLLGLLIAFLIIFREVLFYPKLIFVTDFSILGSSPYYHILYFINGWAPHNLGFASTPGIGGLFSAFWVFLSGGNQVLTQKFMISYILFASIFMYYFITKHITKSKFSAFVGGILYGYSPIVIDNFSAQFLWGYAFLPLIMLFYLNIVEKKPRFLDSVALGFLIALSSSLMPHLLGLIPILFAVFFLINLTRKKSCSFNYLKTVLKYFSIAILVYALLSIQSYAFSILMGKAAALSFTAPSEDQFFLNYAGLSFVNMIRLTGIGNSFLHPIHDLYLQSNGFGFILPFLALLSFFAILKIKNNLGGLFLKVNIRTRTGLHILSFSSIIVLFIIFVETIRYKSFLFDWIYASYPLVITLRNPLAVLMVLAFSYSALIAITSTYLQGLLLKFFNKFKLPKMLMNKNIIGIIIALIIICSYFVYAPVYSNSIQKQTPYMDYPMVYSDVINWMKTQGTEGSFRYLLVPQSHSSQLILPNNYPYQFIAHSGSSYPSTYDYVHSSYDLLSGNNCSTVGSLLAAANVRYVIVVKNTTEFEHVQWLNDGSVRVIGDTLAGNSANFIEIMNKQSDLTIVKESPDYLIYEIQNSLSKVSAFPNAVYIVGGIDAIPQLNLLPDFQSNDNLLIFNGSEPIGSDPNVDLVDTVLFYNLNNTQIASLISSLSTEKQFVVMNTNPVFDEELHSLNSNLLPANYTTDDITIVAGNGVVAFDDLNLQNVTRNMVYRGTSGYDTLFTFTYDFQESIDLSNMDVINYYFKIDGAKETNNVEFGLIDDSLAAARRWFPNILPTLAQNEWQQIAINLTSYSQQDPNFDISHVKKIQFTTYSSQPEQSVSMWVSGVVGTKYTAIDYSSTLLLPKESDWFIKFKSAGSILNVSINGSPVQVISENNGWWKVDPFLTNCTYATISISMSENSGVDELFLSTKESPFGMNDNSVHNITQIGDNHYRIQLNTFHPVFIYLGESYHQNWVAFINGVKLDHFEAFSWCNGFYVNQTGQIEIELMFDDQSQLMLNYSIIGVIVVFPILIALNQFEIFIKFKNKFRR